MKFKDPEVERVYQLNFKAVQDPEGESQRQISGLFAAFQWFQVTDGEQSARFQEAAELLLSAEMRPALRRWYQRCGDNMNPHALEMREHFSKLAGEKFG